MITEEATKFSWAALSFSCTAQDRIDLCATASLVPKDGVSKKKRSGSLSARPQRVQVALQITGHAKGDSHLDRLRLGRRQRNKTEHEWHHRGWERRREHFLSF